MKLPLSLVGIIFAAACLSFMLSGNPDDFVDLPFLSAQAVRSMGFFALGLDVMLCIVLVATWICSIAADHRLRKCAPDVETFSRDKSTAIRAGFTLIELLVVITIIGILAALLLAGIVAVLRKGPEFKNRNEVIQLGMALQNFYAKFGFYPPSKIKLCPKLSGYKATQLDQQSLAYINSIWPSIQWIDPTTQLENTFNWDGSAAMPLAGKFLRAINV